MTYSNSNNSKLKTIEKILRLAIFMTFVGHGIVAIHGKDHWIGYLEFVGFSKEIALHVLKFIGVLDIIVGISILLKPHKYIVIWAGIWAFSAALIRPISGEEIWAFIERGANWLCPLALYTTLLLTEKK